MNDFDLVLGTFQTIKILLLAANDAPPAKMPNFNSFPGRV